MLCVVAIDPTSGVLWAKAVNTESAARSAILQDITRIIREIEPRVTVSEKRDGFGEQMIVAEYGSSSLEYKILEEAIGIDT